MTRVYIIGSLSQSAQIMKIGEDLVNHRYKVRCVTPHITTLKDAVRLCLKNIVWCDTLLVVTKPDGTIGESVTHEVCFAEFLDKQIFLIKGK